MSEFKFACPNCGQHITADSSASGSQLECPTCFRKIVVPQAPSSADSKFILSASQADKPRPPQSSAHLSNTVAVRRASQPVGLILVLVVLVCGAGAAAYVFRDKIFKSGQVKWTMNLRAAVMPGGVVAGNIHSNGFVCDRATLQGGNLTLRAGSNGPMALGVTVRLNAQQSEELSGRSIEVTPDQRPPLPQVRLRWPNSDPRGPDHEFNNGYAMKLVFGQAVSGRMPGKIYICLPDGAHSVVAGAFEAEIRWSPGRQKQPNGPPSPGG